jgi:hypothetical protein
LAGQACYVANLHQAAAGRLRQASMICLQINWIILSESLNKHTEPDNLLY